MRRFTHSIITSSFFLSFFSIVLCPSLLIAFGDYQDLTIISLSYVRVTHDLVSTINLELRDMNMHSLFFFFYSCSRMIDVMYASSVLDKISFFFSLINSYDKCSQCYHNYFLIIVRHTIQI